MSQTVFPSTPTINQIFSNFGRDWKWNGYGWELLGDGGVNYTRRSDYDTLICYMGFALVGSSEADTVWTITKIVTTADGDVTSSIQTENWAWTNRHTL